MKCQIGLPGIKTENNALISPCEKYRYWLSRNWDYKKPFIAFVMLNPSTADANNDDPTIRRCISFAKYWGYGGIAVFNLYALRATNPKNLWINSNPIGPDNDKHLRKLSDRDRIVCAWGANAKTERVRDFVELSKDMPDKLYCLGKTKSGSPRHPLYMPKDMPMIPWTLK